MTTKQPTNKSGKIRNNLFRLFAFAFSAFLISDWIINRNLATSNEIFESESLFRLSFYFKILSLILLFVAPAIEYVIWSFKRKVEGSYRLIFWFIGVFGGLCMVFLLLLGYEPSLFKVFQRNWVLAIASLIYLIVLWIMDYQLMKYFENNGDDGEDYDKVFYEKLVKYADKSISFSAFISLVIYFCFMKSNFGGFLNLDYQFNIDEKRDLLFSSAELFFDGSVVFQIIVSTVIFYVIIFDDKKTPEKEEEGSVIPAEN